MEIQIDCSSKGIHGVKKNWFMNRYLLVASLLRRPFSSLRVPAVRFYRSRPPVTSNEMDWSDYLVDESELPELDETEKRRIAEILKEQRFIRDSVNQAMHQDESKPADNQNTVQQTTTSNSASSNPKVSNSTQSGSSKSHKPKESLLYDFPLPHDGFTAEEYESLEQLRDAVADPANVKTRNPQELFRSMNLTASDRQFIDSEIKRLASEPLHPRKNVDAAPFERLEKLMSEDESIYTSLEQWMKEVEKVVGSKVNNPSSLSEDEIRNLPPAPQKLQEVVQFMLSGKK